MAELVAVRPQSGPQERFLSSPADIAIYGGSVYGGKTFALLMESMRHTAVPGFAATIFRRTTPQITNQGALWDESFRLFSGRAVPMEGRHEWKFTSGAEVRFSHLEYETTVIDYDGAQIALIGFDQLEQFTERQFFYMLARNRTSCGVSPYVRATANPPDKRDHWLRGLLDWWIGEDGYPIPERSGVVRYFTRSGGALEWVDADYRSPEGEPPKSITFIPATHKDNPIGKVANPGYMSSLDALMNRDRKRLKDGCWDVPFDDGMFRDARFEFVDRAPSMRMVRYWDRAATEPSERNPDPDWTAGALCGVCDGQLYIVDMARFRHGPGENERRIRERAEADGKPVTIGIEQEPGSAGVDGVDHYQRSVLSGFTVKPDRPTGDKAERAAPWCALAERGNVVLVRGSWNTAFLAEVEAFPHGKRDQVDAVSGAYKLLYSVPVPLSGVAA